MTRDEAKKILEKNDCIQPDGGLFDGGNYLYWSIGAKTACLDGSFAADQLEAIAVWMRG